MSSTPTFEHRRLKFVATINDETLSETTDPDHELTYVDIGNVDSLGRITGTVRLRFVNAPSRARRIAHDGDVIVSTVRTYLQAIAPIIDPPADLIVSTGFAVVRPLKGILDAGFCKYAFRDTRFLWEVESRSTGVSYPAINASALGDIEIALPPLDEQERIAAWLDAETAHLDALVTEKERMLTLLAERRAARVSHAVTRGLDPAAPLRPSGLDWLGEIPAHWTLARAKTLLTLREDLSTTGDEELLTVSHLTGVTPRSEKDVNMFKAESLVGYKRCQPGDLVVNTLWGWMGAMGVTTYEGIVSPAYHVYRPDGNLEPSFVDALCRSKPFVAEVTSRSKGVWSSRLRIYPDAFLDIQMPVPPPTEQSAITDALTSGHKRETEIEGALRASLSLLTERRRALVSAAVTGRIVPTS